MAVPAARLRPLAYPAALALLGIITWVDYATGYELGLFVFYFIPVGLAAWQGGRAPGLAFAVASAVCWYATDRLTHHPYSHALLIYWETFIRFASFVTTALAVAKIRSDVQQREDLLHVVSHDLRAPLAAVVGQAQLLRARSAAGDFATARSDAILRAAGRMDVMIDDLLDAARFEAGRLRLEVQPVEMTSFVAELLGRVAASLEVNRIVVAPAPAGHLVARADPCRLERVLLNLLSNALKYSPADRRVRLGVALRDRWVAISVADEGPGIADDDLPHVFERFYRGRDAASLSGIGLGLYSARLLVEAQGGRIRVETAPGVGTTFVVELPGAAAAP